MEEIETLPAQEIDAKALAEQIDQQALDVAASQEATIVSIGDTSRELFHEAIAHLPLSEDDVQVVQTEVERLQSERMAEIRGDTRAKAANLPDGVAGLYDDKDVYLAPNHMRQEVLDHENQHRKDGLQHGGLGLDEEMAIQTGIQEIDEKLKGTATLRDKLEVNAMDAAGEYPESYVRTHLAAMKELEARGDAVGVDIASASNRLVNQDDVESFQKVVREMVVLEIAQDDPDALEELAEEAEEQSSPAIVEIIAKTREKYNEGPESVRGPSHALAA